MSRRTAARPSHPARRLPQLVCLAAATAGVGALTTSAHALAGATNNWEANANVDWHLFSNWSFFQVPTEAHEVSLNPYAGPSPALIFINAANGPARAGWLRARDWNCAIEGCDYDVLIQGIPSGGSDAQLLVSNELRSNADWSALFGDGESNLTLLNLDLAAKSIVTHEENGADATMTFSNVDTTILSGGAGVFLDPGTVMLFDGATVRHQNASSSYDFVVQPTATAIFNSGIGENAIRDANLIINGSAFCNGTLRTHTLGGLGTVVLNGSLIVDGAEDSTFLGAISGLGTLTKAGSGTLSLIGQPKSMTGGIAINGGRVDVGAGDQLGLIGPIRFSGGALRAIDVPRTISDQDVILNSGGGIFDVTSQPITIDRAISGSGGLTKRGFGTLTLNLASSYSGNTIVDAGTLRIENPSGSATGSGSVTVTSSGMLTGRGGVSGMVVAKDGATVAPRGPSSSVGAMTAGGMTLENGSTLSVRLMGTTTNQHDRIATGGTVDIEPGAALEVTTANGFAPQAGDSFLVISASAVTGGFDLITAPGGPWCTEVTDDGLVLRYDASCDGIVCPADIDGNDLVGLSDLLAVLAAYGPCEDCDADVTDDGVVDFDDLISVLSAWGSCG